MIRVTVDLVPHGDEAQARRLAWARIVNDGTGSEQRGNYNVVLYNASRPNRIYRQGHLEDFPRLDQGPWELVLQSLLVAGRPA